MVLDYVPASFHVVRHIQPRFTCKGCDTQVEAEMPSLPIERGKPGPGLAAHVLIAKYCDHLPLCVRSANSTRSKRPFVVSLQMCGKLCGNIAALARSKPCGYG